MEALILGSLIILAFGVVASTLAEHPIDLVKIRIQTGAGSVRAAVRGLGTRTSDWPRYYRGLGPGVLQKAATRGPMFLFAEAPKSMSEKSLMGSGQSCPDVSTGMSSYASKSMPVTVTTVPPRRGPPVG